MRTGRKLTTLSMWVLYAALACAAGATGETGTVSPSPTPAERAAVVSDRGALLAQTVQEFVGKRYVHGVPYDQAHALGREALPALQAVLSDTHRAEDWATACATIGSIGDAAGFPILRDFVWRRFKGKVDETTLQALRSAQQCIGLLASDSPSAVAYLTHGADPSFWSKLPWQSPRHTPEKLALLFARLSISGLGYVRDPSARAELVRIQSESSRPLLQREAWAALVTSDSVQTRGLAGYMKSLRERY
jgi:hypothetical protein